MTDQMPYGASYLAFGVAVRFESRDSRLFRKTIEMAQRSLVGNLIPTDDQPQHLFRVGRTKARGFYFDHNGALVTDGKIERGVLKYFDSYLRVTVAENCPDRVFVHSGAVAIDGKAILLPGNSFTGKSTLTHELVKLGCKYLSDEFAILDEDGLVSPYARPINLRSEDGRDRLMPLDIPDGAIVPDGVGLPVGAVLFTAYKENAKFAPKILSPANGMLAITPFVLPIRVRPAYSIRVLQRVMNNAVIIKTKRTHAPRFGVTLLQYLSKVL